MPLQLHEEREQLQTSLSESRLELPPRQAWPDWLLRAFRAELDAALAQQLQEQERTQQAERAQERESAQREVQTAQEAGQRKLEESRSRCATSAAYC